MGKHLDDPDLYSSDNEIHELTSPLYAPLVMGKKLGSLVFPQKLGLLGVMQVGMIAENMVQSGCGLDIKLQQWLIQHESGFGFADLVASGYKEEEADFMILRLEEIGYIEKKPQQENLDLPPQWKLSPRVRKQMRDCPPDTDSLSKQ